MNTVLRAICFALIAGQICACADRGTSLPQYPHSDNAGDFGITVLMVEDKADFLRAWDKPSPPNVKIISQAHSGKPFSIAVLYWGGGADSAGKCQLYFSASLLDNRGIPLIPTAEKPLCTGRAPSPVNELSLGEVIDVAVTSSPTTLKLVVNATDQTTGKTATVSMPLEVVE